MSVVTFIRGIAGRREQNAPGPEVTGAVIRTGERLFFLRRTHLLAGRANRVGRGRSATTERLFRIVRRVPFGLSFHLGIEFRADQHGQRGDIEPHEKHHDRTERP